MRRGAKRQRPVSPTADAVETFEIRQYPAATLTATFSGGVLNIEGTTKADTITVQQMDNQISVAGLRIKSGNTTVDRVDASQIQRITINGLAGNDTIRLAGSGTGTLQDIRILSVINGGDGNDIITGGAGTDMITGGLGNDVIDGGAGVDVLMESANVNLTLTNAQLSGVGTDSLRNLEAVQLLGGAGNNKFDASAFTGSVILDGAGGNDTLIGGSAMDVLIGGAGNDSLVGNGGDDILEGGAGNDVLNGGADNDRFVFSGSASLGTDTIVVGDNQGINTLDFSQLRVGLTRLDLSLTTTQTVNSLLKLTIGNNNAIQNVVGTDLADTIIGNSQANVLEGRDGDDVLVSNGVNDSLIGGAGRDRIDGVLDPVVLTPTPIPDDTNPANLGSHTHVFLVNGAGDNGFKDGFAAYRIFLREQFQFDVRISDWDSLGTSEGHGPLSSDAQFVRDLAGLIDQYGSTERVVLIGHSYGGDSILKVANATHHRIDLLATLDPVGPQGFRSNLAKIGTDISIIGGLLTGGPLGGLLSGLFGGSASNLASDFLRADNLPTVPSNVGYFYNRWQEDGAFPIDYKTSGRINSSAAGSLFNDFGIVDQSRINPPQRGFLDVHTALPNDQRVVDDLTRILLGVNSVLTDAGGARELVLPGSNGADQFVLSGTRQNLTVNWAGHGTLTLHDIARVRFLGGGGDDRLEISDSFDLPIYADGGAGNDVLYGGSANDTLIGGTGNDDLLGGVGNDLLQGGFDRDHLYGQQGNDSLEGGFGNDTLSGGENNDQLDGGGDDDSLTGDAGEDLLNGGDGKDQLDGGTDNDVLNGGANDDTLKGGSGNDLLLGDSGNDSLSGDADQDSLRGGEGDDILRGGTGNDFLDGDAGADNVNGDEGEDTLLVDLNSLSGTLEDTLNGGVGKDSLWIAPNSSNLVFNERTKSFSGDTGNNWLQVVQTGLNDFTVTQRDLLTGTILASLSFELSGGTDTDLETIVIAGLDGNDLIDLSSVDENTQREIILDGGVGDDTLRGSDGHDVLRGQAGNDSLVGNGGNDELHGDGGNDTLEGGAGTDRLYGEDGDDSMNSGEGHDFQVGGRGKDVIEAGEGFLGDVIDGGSEADSITGSDGVDFIQGGEGNDTIIGGAMGDFLDGNAGNDSIIGGRGADIIFGGEGRDFLVAGTSESETQRDPSEWLKQELQVRADLNKLSDDITRVTLEVERLRAIPTGQRTAEETAQLARLAQEELDLRTLEDQLTEVKRELNRERGAILVDELAKAGITVNYQAVFQDMVVGGDDNDTLTGSALQDLLIGGDGDDEFHHSGGQDQIVGGNGNDSYLLDGTESRDEIRIVGDQNPSNTNLEFDVEIITNAILMSSHIRLERDVETIGVRGLGGDDSMTASLGSNARKNLRFDGGEGDDFIDARGLQSDATLNGGNGNDTIYGGSGNDSIHGDAGDDSLLGWDGNDTIHGDAGNDRLLGWDGSDDVSGDDGRDYLFGGRDDDGATGADFLDVIRGGDGDDLLYGSAGVDRIYGGAGNDQAAGYSGNDTIQGDAGNDTLSGGNGNDKVLGNDGNDEVLGDNDRDSVWGGNEDDGATGSGYSDDIRGGSGDDLLYGSAGNDAMYGGDGNDQFAGYAGNDYQRGDAGNDTLNGDAGNDTLNGGSGNDELHGGRDNDILNGEDGRDDLRGEEGNDKLYGGNDNDQLIGGSGNDLLIGDGGGELGEDYLVADDDDPNAFTDTLTGGPGRDSFHYNGRDVVTDRD